MKPQEPQPELVDIEMCGVQVESRILPAGCLNISSGPCSLWKIVYLVIYRRNSSLRLVAKFDIANEKRSAALSVMALRGSSGQIFDSGILFTF